MEEGRKHVRWRFSISKRKSPRANIKEAGRGIVKSDLIYYWQYICRSVGLRPENATTVVLAKPTAVRHDHPTDESAGFARGRLDSCVLYKRNMHKRPHLFPS